MELHPGKVNAILGENGAGKSTLMKILSGVYPDYEGRILYNNKPVYFTSVREAQACGIAIIHQELNLEEAGGAAGLSLGFSARVKAFEFVFSRGAYVVGNAGYSFTLSADMNSILKRR